MIYYNILQRYNNIPLDTLETLCNHATNLDIPTMKALTVPLSFPVSTIEAQKKNAITTNSTAKNTLQTLTR